MQPQTGWHVRLRHPYSEHYIPGYVVGQNALGALNLARAEALALESGCTFLWEDDPDCDWSFVDAWPESEQKRFRSQDHYSECCTLLDSEGNPLASLGGIIDASREYRRLIEAELASEASSALLSFQV